MVLELLFVGATEANRPQRIRAKDERQAVILAVDQAERRDARLPFALYPVNRNDLEIGGAGERDAMLGDVRGVLGRLEPVYTIS